MIIVKSNITTSGGLAFKQIHQISRKETCEKGAIQRTCVSNKPQQLQSVVLRRKLCKYSNVFRPPNLCTLQPSEPT